jgi:hypothetical protein
MSGYSGNEKGHSEGCCQFLIKFNQDPDPKSSGYPLQMQGPEELNLGHG